MPEVGTKTVEYTFTPDEEIAIDTGVASVMIKVPKKQYNKYKKLFISKTGFKKPMKLKK